MWADRCTQHLHCALCALNTNDICTPSTTGLSSGYSIKPSPPSSFLPRLLQSYKSNANQDPCVRCQRIEFYWNQKCFKVHIYRCQAGSSAGLRHAATVPCRRCAMKTLCHEGTVPWRHCAMQPLCTQHQLTQATVAQTHLITVTKCGSPRRRKLLFYLKGFSSLA